jgi:hypothetical protein
LEIIQEINQHPILESGSGRLNFAWFPHPVLQFEFSTTKPEFYVKMGDITLRLTQAGVSIKAHISSIKRLNEGKNQVTGWIKEPVSIGSKQELSYIQFHVVNFHNFTGTRALLTQGSSERRAQFLTEKNTEFSENEQWDGPKVLVKIRNDFAHAEKNLNISQSILIDASRLSLWYLELILLFLCGHTGKYFCRIPKQCQNGELSQVPWSFPDNGDNIKSATLEGSK